MRLNRSQTDILTPALYQLCEVITEREKWSRLDPVIAKTETEMATVFRLQAASVRKMFDDRYKFFFQEASIPFDDDPIFSPGELATRQRATDFFATVARTLLEIGANALIEDVKVGLSFNLRNPRAERYIQHHGAELVALIDEVTRKDMRHVLSYGLENGWSYNRTAQAIHARYAGYYDPTSWWNFDAPRPQHHIETRAHLIAVTEAGNAYETGKAVQVQELRAVGLRVRKRWVVTAGEICDDCIANAAQGWIDADEPFQSGDMQPLAHPACRCAAVYDVVT